jgi:hypothetical protein
METSRIVTLCDLRSQGRELLRRRLRRGPGGRQLPFANGLHDFHARNRTPSRPKGFESQRRVKDSFHSSMILFDSLNENDKNVCSPGGLVGIT